MKKKLCFIATGGTIASCQTPHGLMPVLTGEGLAEAVPELAGLADMDFVQLMQLDSSNLSPDHWRQMAEAVLERYDQYEGFVISHGTDTMAYSAAALYYLLGRISKPVVLTGAQLPMGQEGSDAPGNLLTAVHVAVSGRGGVYLAFDRHVIHGNAAKKMYSKNFHAFYSINRPEAGYLPEGGSSICWEVEAEEGPEIPVARMLPKLDDRVMVLRMLPGTRPELLKLLVDAGYKGIILESFGAGGVPSDESPLSLLPMLDYAAAKGVVLVCTTQCIFDGAHLETYEVGVQAMRHGVLSGEQSTVEALAVKLMIALGEGRDVAEVKNIFASL